MLKIAGRLDEKKIDGSLASFRQHLDYFTRFSLDAIEIPIHCLNVIRHGFLDRKLTNETIQILRDYDFIYSVHAPDHLNLMDSTCNELHLSVLRSTMEFAAGIGAHIVVCHAGQYMPYNQFAVSEKAVMVTDKNLDLLAIEENSLRDLSKEFPSINIAVENARPYLLHSPYCYAERADTLRKQILKINCENVKVNLDIGHLYLAKTFYGFDLFEELHLIGDMIVHCHIHDNFGLPTYYHEKEQPHLVPFGRGDCHMPVGWGKVPILDILKCLTPGYNGILVMELRGRYYEFIQESLENLTKLCSVVGWCREVPAKIR